MNHMALGLWRQSQIIPNSHCGFQVRMRSYWTGTLASNHTELGLWHLSQIIWNSHCGFQVGMRSYWTRTLAPKSDHMELTLWLPSRNEIIIQLALWRPMIVNLGFGAQVRSYWTHSLAAKSNHIGLWHPSQITVPKFILKSHFGRPSLITWQQTCLQGSHSL